MGIGRRAGYAALARIAYAPVGAAFSSPPRGRCGPSRGRGVREGPPATAIPSRGWAHEAVMARPAGRQGAAGGAAATLLRPGRCPLAGVHSHSIVPGGLEVMSRSTRLIPLTSPMMRLTMRSSNSRSRSAQSAVIPSCEETTRKAKALS